MGKALQFLVSILFLNNDFHAAVLLPSCWIIAAGRWNRELRRTGAKFTSQRFSP